MPGQPQHLLLAAAEVMLATPACGEFVYSWVPVLKKSCPDWLVGLVPVRANLAIAFTPSSAILPGNWPAVAPISPSATNGRLLQPPSMVTIDTPVRPAVFRALAAPSAAGSLIA